MSYPSSKEQLEAHEFEQAIIEERWSDAHLIQDNIYRCFFDKYMQETKPDRKIVLGRRLNTLLEKRDEILEECNRRIE